LTSQKKERDRKAKQCGLGSVGEEQDFFFSFALKVLRQSPLVLLVKVHLKDGDNFRIEKLKMNSDTWSPFIPYRIAIRKIYVDSFKLLIAIHGLERLQGLGKLKQSLTSLGLDPAICQLVT
jgi:hypothetical protein